MGVKAAGGVRDLEALKAMVAAGATRIGASAGGRVVHESPGPPRPRALAAAQPPGPPGPFAVDVRAATGALPQDPSFFPPVPTATPIPTMSVGFDVGAHVYLFGVGPAQIGLGASLLRAGGSASPPKPTAAASTTPPPRQTLPDVDTRVQMFTPQLSLNFGSSRGWSYLSAGVG